MNKPFLNRKAFFIQTKQNKKQSNEAIKRLSKRICSLFVHSPSVLVMNWEWDEADRRLLQLQSQQCFSELKKYIILHDITWLEYDGHFSNRRIKVALPEMTDNWIFDHLDSGRDYVGELGIETVQGHFLCVRRTNTITLPESEQSHSSRMDWVYPQNERLREQDFHFAYGCYEREESL